MKRHLLTAVIALATLGAAAADASDPVLLTVDGNDVTVSEFEYLYNKNNQQQAQKQTLDKYLQMFIDYKLKVADAIHAGLNQSPEFVKEFDGYRAELSEPYLRDNAEEERLIDEAYGHRLEDVYVSHIMLEESPAGKALADSIINEINAGRATFEEMAERFSIDRASKVRGGRMGYVTPGRFPWAFEKASYDTKVGQLSPVINSGFGLHIIRPESRTPAVGEVEASHILMLTRGMNEEEAAKQKVRIDSIYEALQAGADFAALATKLSQDPGSARNGGSLGWFGRGQMVSEFDSTAFAMADGTISKPFATSFGYHIIRRTNHRSVAPKAELRDAIIKEMSNDERMSIPKMSFIQNLEKEKNLQMNQAGIDALRELITKAGGYDSTAIAQLKQSDIVLYSFGPVTITAAEAMPKAMITASTDIENGVNIVRLAAANVADAKLMEAARSELASTNKAYRDLVNEYRDGILLYEISKRKVWDKASEDTEGLKKYFNANKKKYAWENPKFKSFIVFASNDSILNAALAYAATLDTSDPAKFTQDMRQKFNREVKVERVIAAKGENPITDYLAFQGPKPEGKQSRWTSYAAFGGRIIDAPEEPADVRGAAVTDYQSELNDRWVKDLHKKYKVKVNKKVFEALKASEAGK